MAIPAVINRAVDLIDCELDLIRMELEHPEGFAKAISAASSHEPLAKWNGSIAELLELTVPVYCAGKLAKPTGEPMAYSDTVTLVENIFGLTISRPYERKSKLFSRQKDKTPFLHKLIAVFRMEIEKFHR